MAATVTQGPPTEVIVGGGPDANKTATTFVPNPDKSSIDKVKEFKASRMGRFSTIVDGIRGGKVDPAKALVGSGIQQVQLTASPGETTPREETAAAESPEGTVDETAAAGEAGTPEEAQDTVGQDETGQPAPDARLQRIQEAQKKAKEDSRRNRAKAVQTRTREMEQEQLRQQNFQLQQQAQRGRQIEQLWKTNPVEAARMAGLTPEQLVQKSLQEGSPEGKIAQLEQMVLQERREREALVQQQRQKDFETGLRAAEETLWKRATNAEKYPNLQGQPKKIIVEMAKTVAKEAKERYLKQTGTVPPLNDGMILRYLNDLYEGHKQEAASSKATGTQKTSGKQAATGSTKAGTAPRTLTNRLTNGTSRPANWASLPRTERVKWMKDEARRT